MSTLTHSEAVTYYAARVRASLHGLAPDVVDDLTDGLEADLTEAILDELELAAPGDIAVALASLEPEALEARFGAADAYAAELASAAGVTLVDDDAESAAPPRPTMRERIGAQRERLRSRFEAWAEATPLVRTALEILVAMRPVWWVARGWGWYVVAFGLVGRQMASSRHMFLPGHLVGWLVLLAFVVLSVQLGRGRFWKGRWGHRLAVLASWVGGVAALVALTNVTYLASTDHGHEEWSMYEQGLAERANGVYIDGMAATNLFVYGADGQPIPDARIVDQDGRWVVLSSPWGGQQSWNDVTPEETWWGESTPLALFDPGTAVNQYPYVFVRQEDGGLADVERDINGDLQLAPGTELDEPTWPQHALSPLLDYEVPVAEPSAEPGVEPSAAPSAGASPGAEAEAGSEAEAGAEPGAGEPSPSPSAATEGETAMSDAGPAAPEATATP